MNFRLSFHETRGFRSAIQSNLILSPVFNKQFWPPKQGLILVTKLLFSKKQKPFKLHRACLMAPGYLITSSTWTQREGEINPPKPIRYWIKLTQRIDLWIGEDLVEFLRCDLGKEVVGVAGALLQLQYLKAII